MRGERHSNGGVRLKIPNASYFPSRESPRVIRTFGSVFPAGSTIKRGRYIAFTLAGETATATATAGAVATQAAAGSPYAAPICSPGTLFQVLPSSQRETSAIESKELRAQQAPTFGHSSSGGEGGLGNSAKRRKRAQILVTATVVFSGLIAVLMVCFGASSFIPIMKANQEAAGAEQHDCLPTEYFLSLLGHEGCHACGSCVPGDVAVERCGGSQAGVCVVVHNTVARPHNMINMSARLLKVPPGQLEQPGPSGAPSNDQAFHTIRDLMYHLPLDVFGVHQLNFELQYQSERQVLGAMVNQSVYAMGSAAAEREGSSSGVWQMDPLQWVESKECAETLDAVRTTCCASGQMCWNQTNQSAQLWGFTKLQDLVNENQCDGSCRAAFGRFSTRCARLALFVSFSMLSPQLLCCGLTKLMPNALKFASFIILLAAIGTIAQHYTSGGKFCGPRRTLWCESELVLEADLDHFRIHARHWPKHDRVRARLQQQHWQQPSPILWKIFDDVAVFSTRM